MARRVSTAQLTAQLSELTAEVAYGGQHVIVESCGRPLAALVSIADLELLRQGRPTSARPNGALALAGAWREVDDEDIDSLMADIYAGRERDAGRPGDVDSE